MRMRLATVGVAIALALGGAACGDDTDPGTDNTGQPTPETDASNGGSIVSTPENDRDGPND